MTEPSLNYSRSGNHDLPTILYLHGFMGDRRDWDDIATRLGDGYCHLQVDLPGHGDTDPDLPERSYTMPETAELLIGLLDSLSVDTCRLVGYSMGARLSLFLLVNYPERFEQAVIESGSPGLRNESERAARREHDSQLAECLASEPLDRFVDRWMEMPLFETMNRNDQRYRSMIARRQKNRPDLLARSLTHLGTGSQPPLWESLSSLPTPTLFVAGELDNKFSALAEQMADLCPAGRTGIIPSAGHNTHFERPDEFAAQIARFFDRN